MRIIIAFPFTGLLGAFYLFAALVLMPLYIAAFLGVFSAAGLSPHVGLILSYLVVLLSLVLSPVNIVLVEYTVRRVFPSITFEYAYGIPVPVPRVVTLRDRGALALNVGGALVPMAVATAFLLAMGGKAAYTLPLIIAASLIIKRMSRVVPTIGVVTPLFVPPLVAALMSLVFIPISQSELPLAAYVIGVFGAIIGADILNLPKILRYKPKFASIGGAGVFDGIYLTGLLAGVLAMAFS